MRGLHVRPCTIARRSSAANPRPPCGRSTVKARPAVPQRTLVSPHDRPEPMAIDFRRFAVAITGFCTFLNLYAPQALLPELSREFGVGPAEISTMITASTLAIALTAPFTGAIADVLGRKRLITAAMFAAAVPTVMAPLAGVAGIYVMGSSIGGFCGRLIPGLLSEAVGWRASFLVLAAISLVGAV